MKNISGDDEAFDMEELRINLPKNRRGLSRYYAEKARSFACVLDVKCLEDLKKPTHEPLDDDDDDDDDDANKKRRRKKNRQSSSSSFSAVLNNNNNNNVNFQKYPCRRVSSSIHFSSPCVGV
ncbi:unnamed protein product [Cochlearia groenlandica]